MKVSGKTILVTGGGSGMGRELVLQLLAKNSRVITIDIHPQALEETRSLAGKLAESLTCYVADIADGQALDDLKEKILAGEGHLDALINNAGIIQPFVRVKDLGSETIERVMQINFFGPVYLTRLFLPHLLTRPEAHIVNISSMGGFLPVPGQTIYGASKAALKLFTEGLFAELADTSVRVTVVFPGAVNTNITTNSGLEMPKSASAQQSKSLPASDAARQIIEAMEQDRFRVLVGKDARIMDLFYRMNPKSAVGLITRKMKGLLPAQ